MVPAIRSSPAPAGKCAAKMSERRMRLLSAAMPTFLSLAVFPNWYTALAVLGLFVLSDQLLGGFIEPPVAVHW